MCNVSLCYIKKFEVEFVVGGLDYLYWSIIVVCFGGS